MRKLALSGALFVLLAALVMPGEASAQVFGPPAELNTRRGTEGKTVTVCPRKIENGRGLTETHP